MFFLARATQVVPGESLIVSPSAEKMAGRDSSGRFHSPTTTWPSVNTHATPVQVVLASGERESALLQP